jgi:hypothetical protein
MKQTGSSAELWKNSIPDCMEILKVKFKKFLCDIQMRRRKEIRDYIRNSHAHGIEDSSRQNNSARIMARSCMVVGYLKVESFTNMIAVIDRRICRPRLQR